MNLVFFSKQTPLNIPNYHTLSYSLNNTTWENDRVSTRKSQEIENFMELAKR
jgi:hypothetical protein